MGERLAPSPVGSKILGMFRKRNSPSPEGDARVGLGSKSSALRTIRRAQAAGLTGNPLTAGVDWTLMPSRTDSVKRGSCISFFTLEMISLARFIRLVFFMSIALL